MKEIFERVSVRKYTNAPIEPEKVELLLRAAMAAPSAGNQQPWCFCVVRNREVLDKLAYASPYTKLLLGAPMAIVLMGASEGLRNPTYWEQDLSAATQNLLLEAEHLGLGAVWMGIAPGPDRMQIVREAIGTTNNPFAIVAIGYPAEKAAPHDRYDAKRVMEIN